MINRSKSNRIDTFIETIIPLAQNLEDLKHQGIVDIHAPPNVYKERPGSAQKTMEPPQHMPRPKRPRIPKSATERAMDFLNAIFREYSIQQELMMPYRPTKELMPAGRG
ncbi:MAG: hypothetical protein H6904_04685 [Rhodobacteraceae bacterium]|nr:hypothetical protein [Paracoccaceae bacterium]